MAADPLAAAAVPDGSAQPLATPDDCSQEAPLPVDSAAEKLDGWSSPPAALADLAPLGYRAPVAAAVADHSVRKRSADLLAMVAPPVPASAPDGLGSADLELADSPRAGSSVERAQAWAVAPPAAPDDFPRLAPVPAGSPGSMCSAADDYSAQPLAVVPIVPAVLDADGCSPACSLAADFRVSNFPPDSVALPDGSSPASE